MIRAPQSLRSMVVLALVSAVALGCSSKKPAAPPSMLDKIPLKEAMVKIDGHEISGAWVRNWCVTEYLTVMRGAGVPMKIDEYTLIKGGMDLLGKMYVIALEAQRRGITVTDEEIQAQLDKEAARFESKTEWEKRLEKSGLTPDLRRQQVRIEILFNKYREQVVAPDVKARLATPEMARQYYGQHQDVFQQPRQLHLLHITRSLAKDATEDIRRREREAIDKARQRIANGEAFEAVAREVSTEATAIKGGDVGWVTEQTPIQAQIKPAVLALKQGELSAVLESPQAYHLFKAVEIKDAGVRSFEASKDEIMKRLFEKGMNLEMEKAAGTLRNQLIAEKKYQVRDLKQLLGEPPKPDDGKPPVPGQGPATTGKG